MQKSQDQAKEKNKVVEELLFTIFELESQLFDKEADLDIASERRKQLEIINSQLTSDVAKLKRKVQELQGERAEVADAPQVSNSIRAMSSKVMQREAGGGRLEKNLPPKEDPQEVRLAAALRVLSSVSSLLDDSAEMTSSFAMHELYT
ncbi:hypothetical protein CYMTET_4015 [Cymbomonas tetramitiformis]|uniref:Uncharacterized protein n=1 Tax=Cymbomonas tetramitiformis TaxID=36881 RepID=A0AAE0LKH8_9CHLO|nr:hypothetical protein CYMTET_4015 [Cymbomonas tetramitiformis]